MDQAGGCGLFARPQDAGARGGRSGSRRRRRPGERSRNPVAAAAPSMVGARERATVVGPHRVRDGSARRCSGRQRQSVAADIAGYRRLVASDEDDTLKRLLAFRDIFADVVGRAGGRISDTAGDAVLAECPSASRRRAPPSTFRKASGHAISGVPDERRMFIRIGIRASALFQPRRHDVPCRAPGRRLRGRAVQRAGRSAALIDRRRACAALWPRPQLSGRPPSPDGSEPCRSPSSR